MVLSSDQGTVVSVDGAKTWSTWYNQPTAQIYHIAADNRFPYWLYGAQQDSGAVGVSTWSRMGTLSFPQLGANLPGGREQHRRARSRRRQPALWQRRPTLRPGTESSGACSAANCPRQIPTTPTAERGRCRRSFRLPIRRSTTRINLSSARATAARRGRRSAPISRGCIRRCRRRSTPSPPKTSISR